MNRKQNKKHAGEQKEKRNNFMQKPLTRKIVKQSIIKWLLKHSLGKNLEVG